MTAPATGGIGHEDLFILDAPQHDKMSGLRKMPFGHQSHDQLSVCQGIQNALRFRSGTPFNGKLPRKVHKTQIKNRSVFIRRMFSDFQALELDHFAEMDTVHSSQDSKRVILTFFLTREKLFLAFIMNRCTKGAVKLVFNKLEHQLGTYDFLTLFNTILTDRGSEFGDPESLENGINGIMQSSIYYCDPMRSSQKGGIEQTHTMLRMILPKKTSFEYLTQWDLRTIVDHINSTPRESLGGRTPYDVALAVLGFI